MTHKIFLRGGDEMTVPDNIANDLIYELENTGQNSTKFFKSGKDLIRISEVKGVRKLDEIRTDDKTQKVLNDKTLWEDGLLKRSKLPIAEKVRLEIIQRIKPALSGKRIATSEQTLKEKLLKFFTAHPEYPFCPFGEWKDEVFGAGVVTLPNICKVIVLHDCRVGEWIDRDHKVLEQKSTDEFSYDDIVKSLNDTKIGGEN